MVITYALATAPTVAALAGGYLAGRRRSRVELAAQRLRADAEQLRANTDPLTGLANRSALYAELDRRVQAGGHAVLLADLDDFKTVNDTLGHASGDAVLITVARRLSALVAGAGVVARLSGDEFVLVAASPAPAISRLLAYDVVRAVARPIDIDGRLVTVRASVGVVHALAGDTPRALLDAADIAMYQAKGTRVGVAEYDPCQQPAAIIDVRPPACQRELAAVVAHGLVGVHP